MVEGGVPATTFLPSSWTDRGAARASGRDLPPGEIRPRRGDDPPDGVVVRVQGAWASGQEGPDSPRAWRIQGALRPPDGGWGVPVAESVLAPPGPIPNPVVTQRSAGEYWGGDPLGGEAAADTPHPLPGARRPGGQPVPRPI